MNNSVYLSVQIYMYINVANHKVSTTISDPIIQCKFNISTNILFPLVDRHKFVS